MRITFSLLSFTIETGREDEQGYREVDMGSSVERAERHPIGFTIDPPRSDDDE